MGTLFDSQNTFNLAFFTHRHYLLRLHPFVFDAGDEAYVRCDFCNWSVLFSFVRTVYLEEQFRLIWVGEVQHEISWFRGLLVLPPFKLLYSTRCVVDFVQTSHCFHIQNCMRTVPNGALYLQPSEIR